MNKQDILKTLKKLRESKKRNFNQSFDLIINLKQLDLKKPDNQVDSFVLLPNKTGKKRKICGLVDKELSSQSKETLNKTITKEDFSKLSKKEIKKLSSEYDYFIAQATIMPDVAKTFGKILGPKGKMPNPKAGCVVPPNTNLKALRERLEKTIKLQTKEELIIKAIVGKENMEDDKIADNILTIYNNLLQVLPEDKNNIKNVMLKLTMSEAIEIGGNDGSKSI